MDQDFLSVMAHLPDAVIAVGKDQCILFFNRAAETTFQYEASDVIGQPLDLLLPQAFRTVHREYVRIFFASASPARHMNHRRVVEGLRRDGSTFPAETTLVKGQGSDSPCVYAIVRDMSAHRAREAALAASEQRYRAIMEGCPDAILVASAETGRLIEANEAAGELFGCSPRELIGVHQSELHPPDRREKFVRHFREHIEAGRILVPQGEIQSADGTVKPVEIAARPVSINGQLTVVGFFRDITHRIERERKLEEALRAASVASTAKAMFLANMSHELRTPLNSIIGFADLLEREIHGPHSDRRYSEYAGYISSSGHHLLELVNDVLNISAIEMGKYKLQEEWLDLTEIIDECRTMLRLGLEQAGVELRVLVEPNAGLYADRRSVKQMLINLLSNAVKHTDKGGSITVDAARTDAGEFVLRVADTGRGIDEKRLKAIVEPFGVSENIYTRSRGGIGLGLSITRSLMEMHAGRLSLASRPGHGFEAQLVFPAHRAEQPAGAAVG